MKKEFEFEFEFEFKFKEVFINLEGKKTSILIDCCYDHVRVPCFVLGLSSHYHDKFSVEFRSRYQLVLIDLYWTNNSDYDKQYVEKLSYKDMVDDIEKIRRKMEEKFGELYSKIVIVGHSTFGYLCLEYASYYQKNLYGIINVGTPPHFQMNEVVKVQESYLDNNFEKTDERYVCYREKKNEIQKDIFASKERFVKWYTNMGPILWKERDLWKDQNRKATKIWDPWTIQLQGGEVAFRDVNMDMYKHHFMLASNFYYQDKMDKINVPVLWVVGLLDILVSMYFFDSQENKELAQDKIEYCYVNTGHWPMYEKKGIEFDRKTAQWIENIYCQSVENEEDSGNFFKI